MYFLEKLWAPLATNFFFSFEAVSINCTRDIPGIFCTTKGSSLTDWSWAQLLSSLLSSWFHLVWRFVTAFLPFRTKSWTETCDPQDDPACHGEWRRKSWKIEWKPPYGQATFPVEKANHLRFLIYLVVIISASSSFSFIAYLLVLWNIMR